MLDTRHFGAALRSRGFDLFTGVPCSYLRHLINYAIAEVDYLNVANEGEAVAVAVGARLGGRKPVVMFQNSGLTNALSPLVSLVQPYRIPVFGLVTLRGEPGIPDAPQHTLMGAVTTSLLDLVGLRWSFLQTDESGVEQQLAEVEETLARGQSYFFVVREKTFSPFSASARRVPNPAVGGQLDHGQPAEVLMTRSAALQTLLDEAPEAALIATTGYTGRELSGLADRDTNFYMTGSMGCASSIGLGLAHAQPDRRVIVVDGDGAALMRLSALPALGQRQPANLLHLVLDNACHESTGGQATLSSTVDFARMAAAAGYPVARHVFNQEDLASQVGDWYRSPERRLTFLVLRTAPGVASSLSRPEQTLPDLAQRFHRAVAR
jgi:phosphonopyruvate decarboxylase